MDSSGESRDIYFFVNYKRGLTLTKTELDSMSKRKLTTKFEEEPQKIISIFRLTPSVFQAIRRPISPHACVHEPEYAGL